MEVIYNNSDGVKHVYIGTQVIFKFNLEACTIRLCVMNVAVLRTTTKKLC